jgi:hypothetical protein
LFAVVPEWTGQGPYRLLTEVSSIDLGTRLQDERPAELNIDFKQALLNQLGLNEMSMEIVFRSCNMIPIRANR